MVARVTRYRIRPGKAKEFAATVESLMPALDQLRGFRALLVLGGEDPGGREGMAISLWDSAEDMRSSESDKVYYGGLARLMSFCESFSPMHTHQVLKSKFANR